MADDQSIKLSELKNPLSERDVEIALKELMDKVNDDPEILALIVFGSYARHESFRDVDVCLVCKVYPTSTALERRYVFSFSEILDIHFFDRLPLYIRKDVCHDGDIRIMKDYDQLCDIYLATFRALDSFYPRYKMIIDLH